MSSEYYVSIDIESDGPSVLTNSMLSLGAVIVNPDLTLGKNFYVNLLPLDGHSFDPKTKAEFWDKNPGAWEAAQVNRQPPEKAMWEFIKFLKDHTWNPVAVAYPAGYDYQFVSAYLYTYGEYNPFGFSCLDMKTLAMGMLGLSFKDTTKKHMPQQWFENAPPHTHIALDDAYEQASLFIQMMKTNHTKNADHQKMMGRLIRNYMMDCGYKTHEINKTIKENKA